MKKVPFENPVLFWKITEKLAKFVDVDANTIGKYVGIVAEKH